MGGIRDPEQQQAAREEEAGAEEQGQPANPWNIMIKHRQVHKRGRRSQMAVSFTDPHVSMDLLRAVLQPTINEEIQAVFNKYMKFFQKAAVNVRENVGEEVDPEQLIQDVCRSSLEQAKLLFTSNEKEILRPTLDLPVLKRGRQYEEESSQRGSPIPKKGPPFEPLQSIDMRAKKFKRSGKVWFKNEANTRKGRPPGSVAHNDRASVGMGGVKLKSESIRRDGPKWDPARLTESSKFVLGSRANKALGMGGTRGRIYIKHPDLFKYAADPQDKHWLAENQHMRATGGKMAYMLLEEDIHELAVSDEYRSSPELKIEELKPFIPPRWMIEKMQKYIETVRSENE